MLTTHVPITATTILLYFIEQNNEGGVDETRRE